MEASRAEASKGHLGTLYAAGFITAFGAHSVAANLAPFAQGRDASLIELGILLALYDGAEIVLKPVFGMVADRVGARALLICGLVAFAVASAAFAFAGEPDAIALARLAQGGAAAAFSPAAGALVAAAGGAAKVGRSFGGYGAAKGLGYVTGPVVGGGLVAWGGFELLFGVVAVAALSVAVMAIRAVPSTPVPVRQREGRRAAVRRISRAEFVLPTVALAAGAAALGAAIGFIPARVVSLGRSTILSGAAVSVMAAVTAVAQPRVGKLFDERRLESLTGMRLGVGLCAAGFAVLAFVPSATGIFVTAGAVGLGVALLNPLGFAELARWAPRDRVASTLGAAEVGREMGDAGGPLFVGLFSGFGLAAGTGAFALVLGATTFVFRRPKGIEGAKSQAEAA